MSASNRANRQPNPPIRENDPGQGAWLFTFLSTIISLLIIAYGVSFLLGQDLKRWQIGFGSTSIAYGLVALGALICAVRKSGRRCVLIIQFGAAFYLLIYLLVLVIGFDLGFNLVGVPLLALLLWCQWFAVTQAVRKT